MPLVLKNLQKGLQARFDALTPGKRRIFDMLVGVNKALTKSRPRLGLSRKLLGQVHAAFGGELRAIIVGGAFTEPQTLQFFYDLGIPVANGYGLTEAGTAITVNDLRREQPQRRQTRADLVHEGCGPADVCLGVRRRLLVGQQRRGEVSRAGEVAALEVIRTGAAVVHVGPHVRQRGEESPGLGGERVLAAVAGAV